MKTILVPVEQHDDAAASIELAVIAASAFGSVVEGFALRIPPLVGVEWDPASAAMMNSLSWDEDKARADAEALFGGVMARHGIRRAHEREGGEAGPAGLWLDQPPAGDEFLGTYARACDLTVVGQPRIGGSAISTLEAALFESGGPILIAPRPPVRAMGEMVALAWNGSSETARTIGFALPLMRQARRVLIVADDGRGGLHPSGELVRRRLERHGVSAELKLLGGGKIRSGQAILDEAAAFGADLLVKGAYTQSRLRQMIFGGATRHVLEKAEIPVFMAH